MSDLEADGMAFPPPTAQIVPTGHRHRAPSWSLDTAVAVVVSAALGAGLAALVSGWIGLTVVIGDSMKPTLESGDLVLTQPQPSYSVGEVIVFTVPIGQAGEGARVIHRITGEASSGFETTGDNRDGADMWEPTEADIVGTPWLTVPHVGSALLWLRSPLLFGLLLAVVAFRLTLALPPRPYAALVPLVARIPRNPKAKRGN